MSGTVSDTDLLSALKQYWGYSAFRPMQEQIVRSLLGGHDVCVIMPTGGGKSLCYQLPALVSGGTAIVVSPLIALMQDQAAQLAAMGIPAAVLNSFQPREEQSAVMRKACAGECRLLYLSPERLARGDTVGWLKNVPVAFFAIDEAHCISEWGHEFRPEYRQLNSLRVNFPASPIAALTASATRVVRHDIVKQLRLRDPDKYIASFHRANLRYLVKECESQREQWRLLKRALRIHSKNSVIVYAPTIKRVEETVDFLEENGIAAIPYHGQMEADVRKRNQEQWMGDAVRVLVGTIAFGLGINKADVRAVIHLSLPKSIEQYYQEAGRAGRDGEPADCILLWQPRDTGLLAYFIGKIEDSAEKARAWQRYRVVREFVESARCRHRQICLHFGETPKWASCQACDVCGREEDWLVRGRKGKPAEIDAEPVPPPKAPSGDGSEKDPVDAELGEYLREWRRNTARERGVPAFVVMHDTSLEGVCRERPKSLAELRAISGFGERKTEAYGREILAALQRFENGARATAQPQKTTKPAEEVRQLLVAGHTFQEIAAIRGRQLSTIISNVALLIENGELEFQPTWIDPTKLAIIEAAIEKVGAQWLKPIKDSVPPEITFEEIKLVAARWRSAERKSA